MDPWDEGVSIPGDHVRLHLLALATLAATFVLLLVGGSVHATGSSLACPDWPLCFGQVFPAMEGGVLFEHSHRLVASSVGVLTLALAWSLRRTPLRRIGFAAVGMVVLQGVLGGVTVLLRLPLLVSMSHLALSQLFFCTVAFLAIRTCPRRSGLAPLPGIGGRLRIAALAVLAQILVGGAVRHLGAGLACGAEFPLCHGGLVPSGLYDGLQLFHRLLGISLLALIPWALAPAWNRSRVLVLAPVGVLVAQLGLGIASVLSFLAPLLTTLHLGAADLLLLQLVGLSLLLDPPQPLGAEAGGADGASPLGEGMAA